MRRIGPASKALTARVSQNVKVATKVREDACHLLPTGTGRLFSKAFTCLAISRQEGEAEFLSREGIPE